MSTLTEEGVAALQAGDTQTAIAKLEAAVAASPTDFDACLYLGGAYGQAGRHMDAIKTVTQAVQLQPANAQARYNLAVAMEQGGYNDQALQVYEQALHLQPDYPKAHEALKRLEASGNDGFGSPLRTAPEPAPVQEPPAQPVQQAASAPAFGQQPPGYNPVTPAQAAQPPTFNPLAPPQQAQPSGYNPLAPEATQQPFNPLAPTQPTQAFTPPSQQPDAFGRPTIPVGQPAGEAGLGSYMAPPPPAQRTPSYGAPGAYGARPGFSSVPSYDDQFSIGQAFKDFGRILFSPKVTLSEMAGCDTSRSAWALFCVYQLFMLVVLGIAGPLVGAKLGSMGLGLVFGLVYWGMFVVINVLNFAFFALIVHLLARAFGSTLRYGASIRAVIYAAAPQMLSNIITFLIAGIIISSVAGAAKNSGAFSPGGAAAHSSPFGNPSAGANSNPFATPRTSGSNPFGGPGGAGAGQFGAPGANMPGPFGAIASQMMGYGLIIDLVGLLFGLWMAILCGAAIANIHEISGGSAAGVVILSTIIYIALGIGLAILLLVVTGIGGAMMAGMGGAASSAGASGGGGMIFF